MADAPLVAVILDAARAYDRLIIGGIAQFVRERTGPHRGTEAWSLSVEEDPLQKLPDLARWHGQGIIANFDDRRVAAALDGLGIPIGGVGGGFGWHDPASGIPYIYTSAPTTRRSAGSGRGTCSDAACPRSRSTAILPDARPGGRRSGPKPFVPRSNQPADRATCSRAGMATPAAGRRFREELCSWLASLPQPLGLMACNDLRARHVLEACQRIGVVARASSDTLASDDDAVVAMLKALRASPWRKPRIATVADGLGISPQSLEQRFQTAVGRSLHAEFVRQRMQRLRTFVVETDLPLKTIAARTGFPSLQYMTTFFRRHTGTTPARLRAMERRSLGKGAGDG